LINLIRKKTFSKHHGLIILENKKNTILVLLGFETASGIALPLPVPQSPCLCGVSATIANAEYKLLLLLISNVIFYK